MRRLILTVFISLSLSALALIRTDGFSIHAIQAPLIGSSTLSPSSDILKILSQKFTYLNKGRQCFVFESQDGEYVLKFFNCKYLKMPWYAFLFKEKEATKRSVRCHFYENSYKIAKDEFGDEILYLHLAKNDQLPKISFVDKAHREYHLSLGEIPFVLQRKGTPFYVGLQSIYESKGIGGLCSEIDSFLSAISFRISKQIGDADHDVEHNWGYVDGHIFHLDPGRLYYKDLSDLSEQRQEWWRATHNFRKWLQTNHPEAATYFDLKINLVSKGAEK